MKFYLLILSLKLIYIKNTNGGNKTPSLLFLKAINADEYSVPIKGDRSLVLYNHKKLELYSVCPSTHEVAVATLADFQMGMTYKCNNPFEPQHHTSCRMKCKGVSDKLTIFSYKIGFENEENIIGFKEENKDKDRHFIIYTLCSDSNSNDVFARYKVIPRLSKLQETPNINHSDWSRFHKDLQDIYSTQFQDKRRKLSVSIPIFKPKKSFADYWTDQIIPQTLVPSFNISEKYSKGATNHKINHKPQWLSLANDWDTVNHFIKLRAYRFNWTIYTGTYEILLDKKKKRIELPAELTIPRIWWILIEHKEINEDIESVKAIIIAMSNIPENSDHIDKEGTKLCEEDVCDTAKWNDVGKINNFIHCCTVNEDLGVKLINKKDSRDLLELPEVDDTKKITSAQILVSYYSPDELSNIMNPSSPSPPTSPKSTQSDSSTLDILPLQGTVEES